MEALTIGTTYAAALYEAARDRDKIDLIAEELSGLLKVFDDEPQFLLLLCSPSVGAVAKKSLAAQVFKGKISDELLNFLFVLVDKRRIGQFRVIAKAYQKLLDERTGLSKGLAYSAVPLPAGKLARLEEETGKLLRKNVKLESLVDDQLIGGVKILIDGKLIDASVRKRLEDLREQLAQ
ncbi:MAG: ATP synthase F1 subunit delta [Clostridiales Family XIII bacterium]|jgi:ATP synthase F1 delta subunit|nr:ATP synthase F1 subunit delta [Clostridiales Family XIII bacterium]